MVGLIWEQRLFVVLCMLTDQTIVTSRGVGASDLLSSLVLFEARKKAEGLVKQILI